MRQIHARGGVLGSVLPTGEFGGIWWDVVVARRLDRHLDVAYLDGLRQRQTQQNM
jgi:hypothetical protein